MRAHRPSAAIKRARQWSTYPSEIERAVRALTETDRGIVRRAAGFPAACPVCRQWHQVSKDVVTAIICIEAVAGVKEKRLRWPYSKTGLLLLPRTIREGLTLDSVLLECPCGMLVTARDLRPLLERYMVTGQRQFIAGGVSE